jgi:predicted transcriptional regulator
MGRRPDAEKQEMIKKLGIEDTKKNWSKKELQDRLSRQHEQEMKAAEAKAMTQLISGNVPDDMVNAPIPLTLPSSAEDPLNGLSERQKLVARLRMRGLSQEAIASVVGVSQPIISKELVLIKTWQTERGKNVNQAEVVGSTASLYEEVEYRAWELYHGTTEIGEKAKSLAVVMQAREKHTKLLMDLGLIKKASQEFTHKIEVSPFIEKWQNGEAKKSFGDAIVAKQLTALADPTPENDAGIEDAEVVEDEDDQPRRAIYSSDDLAEPTPDDSEDDLLD